jgi:D-alanine--D-alanine ligase
MERREMIDLKSLRVSVVAGGLSGERPYNLCAGQAVRAELAAHGVSANWFEIGVSPDEDARVLAQLVSHRPDFVFLCVTEEVPIQGALDLLGIAYNGSGAAASLLTLDKVQANEALRREGIRVPDRLSLISASDRDSGWKQVMRPAIQAIIDGSTVVVKPRSSGCSFGVSIVDELENLSGAVEQAMRFSADVIIEEFIAGEEITIGVIGKRALPPITPSDNGIYDSHLKWLHVQSAGQSSGVVAPKRFSADITQKVIDTTDRVRRALGLRNAWRMDAIVQRSEICVLEVNALPKLAGPLGEMCIAAREDGLNYFEMLRTIANDALLACHERQSDSAEKSYG